MEAPDNGGNEEEAGLLERVHACARTLARRLVRSRHRADDIAQDVALDFLRRQRSGWAVRPERVEAYVATIVFRRRSDMRVRRRRSASRDWAFLTEINASRRAWMDPRVQWEERELDALYRRTRDSLPMPVRETFVAVREQGLSYAEAARRLGVSVKMIAKRITQAQRVFRAVLREYGIRVPREKNGRTPPRFVSNTPDATVLSADRLSAGRLGCAADRSWLPLTASANGVADGPSAEPLAVAESSSK